MCNWLARAQDAYKDASVYILTIFCYSNACCKPPRGVLNIKVEDFGEFVIQSTAN